MRRHNVACFVVVTLTFLAASLGGCSGGSSGSSGGSTQHNDNGVLVWPFDTAQGAWVIENGYNWNTSNGGLDHGCSNLYESCYELYSFDFQRRGPTGSTEGQSVLSPASGNVLDVSEAVNGAGRCVRISIDGHDRYYILICHVDNPLTGHRDKGQPLGTVNARTDYGDHIHMTLYSLPPNTDDTVANASKRQAIAFTDPWTIGGCNYPSDGSVNQRHGDPVPCTNPNSGGVIANTATPSPTATANPAELCRERSDFANAASAPTIKGPDIGFLPTFPSVPFPPTSLGYLVSSSTLTTSIYFPIIQTDLYRICSPNISDSGVRDFYAIQMPRAGWIQSATFPYGGDPNRDCGDPFCWNDGGDKYSTRFVSLETVTALGPVTVYELRLSANGEQAQG